MKPHFARPYITSLEDAQALIGALDFAMNSTDFQRILGYDEAHAINKFRDYLWERASLIVLRDQDKLRAELAKNRHEQHNQLTTAEQAEYAAWEAKMKKNEHESLVPLEFRKPVDPDAPIARKDYSYLLDDQPQGD